MSVTADTVRYTADGHYPTADGFVPGVVIAAEVVEPARLPTHVTADTVRYTADATYPTADGFVPVTATDFVDAEVIAAGVAILAEAANAADALDADVIAATRGFWVDRVSRRRVVGVGYGVLPQLEGEAHGVVGVAGAGVGALVLSGEARGEVDDGVVELLLLMLAA